MQIKNKIIPIIIFFLSLLTTNLVLYADEFDISASEISIDKENEIITGKGSVKVNDEQGRIIKSDNATYEKKIEFFCIVSKKSLTKSHVTIFFFTSETSILF